MNKHTSCFHSVKIIILVHFYTFGISLYIIKCQKGIFECICFIFSILQRVFRTRKFLVCPVTFGLKFLVSILVSVSVPISQNFNFLVSFRYPFWKILDFLVSLRYPETYFRLFPTSPALFNCQAFFFRNIHTCLILESVMLILDIRLPNQTFLRIKK